VTPLGPVLVAIGVADLVAGGLAGEPVRRPVVGTLVGGSAAGAAVLAVGGTASAAAVAALLSAGAVLAWLLTRRAAPRLPVAVPLVVLAVTPPGAAALIPRGARGGAGALGALLDRLEVGAAPDRVVLAAGVALVLLATANAVVRLVLDAAGPDVARSQDRLRGGRLIGAAERLLVAGLAAAGQPAAAALVVTAKAVVRFPELSSTARRDALVDAEGAVDLDPLARVDAVTEYFLLGSLTSLGVAFLAAWLVA
jgi:hypothetical protein